VAVGGRGRRRQIKLALVVTAPSQRSIPVAPMSRSVHLVPPLQRPRTRALTGYGAYVTRALEMLSKQAFTSEAE